MADTLSLPLPKSKSTPLVSERASLSYDVNDPNATRTLTVTKDVKNKRGRTTSTTTSTFTQGADGQFRDSSGTLWSGEYSGEGGQIRAALGKKINDANLSDKTQQEWADTGSGTGLNKNITPITGDENKGGDAPAGDAGPAQATDVAPTGQPVSNRGYDDLRYPLTLLDKTDFMKITMFRYEPGRFRTGEGSRASDRITQPMGTVILPIPNQLADGNNVGWGQNSMNGLQMAGLNAASGVMQSDNMIQGMTDAATSAINAAKGNAGQLGSLARTFLLSQLPGINQSTNELLARGQGAVLNPNLELLFNGPSLRSFTYSFRLSGRNSKETIMIRKIIRFFKQGMSVKEATGGGLFLATPNVFGVDFFNDKGLHHPFLNRLKKCALTSFAVNYVPDGTYMTLPDSAMTTYELALSFQELDPIYDSDYTKLDNDQDLEIGF